MPMLPDTCVSDVNDGENTCKFISAPTSKPCSWNASYRADNPEFGLSGHQKCMTFKNKCAVVASSAHLLESFRGAEIDSHDVVIRMNGAPDGNGKFAYLAKDVGARTDVRFLNQFALLPPEELSMEKCIFLHESDIDKTCGKQCSHQVKCEWDKCSAMNMKCRGSDQKKKIEWGKHHVFIDNVHGEMANILRKKDGGWRTAGLVG